MRERRSVTVRAAGKVNLQLAVGGRRRDGFHELANIFLAVSCYDEVTVRPSSRLQVRVSGPTARQVPADGSNLVARAARLLGERYGIEPNVRIDITKRIPVGGGMAGGSADGAGALVACNALWGLGVESSEVFALAAELGSDVPFSLLGGVALGRGRGERLRRLPVRGTSHWVFAASRTGLSTPAVYAEHDRLRAAAGLPVTDTEMPPPTPSAQLVRALADGDAKTLGPALHNDLEAAATRLQPSLVNTLKAGTEAGAVAGLLCGTGATCAFLAESEGGARRLASRLRESGTCASVWTAYGPVPGPRLV